MIQPPPFLKIIGIDFGGRKVIYIKAQQFWKKYVYCY